MISGKTWPRHWKPDAALGSTACNRDIRSSYGHISRLGELRYDNGVRSTYEGVSEAMSTSESVSSSRVPPAGWINSDLYPYHTKAFQVPAGTMRYLDEGSGEPIVLVHGNPSWSFVYRKQVAALRDDYRCIAPDHIGFGQSDKPHDWSYLPQEHAANLEALLESLELDGITLVVQDWGGPIGLSYAIAHPERIKRLVVLNTWLWSVREDWYYRAFSGIMGGAVGRYFCERVNLFARAVVPRAYGDPQRLTREIHRHYLDSQPTPDTRKGTWVFPQQIIGASAWLASLWAQREKLANKPTLIAWGMKDIAFREKELRRWQEAFPHANVTRLEGVGHYVQDEAGETLVDLMQTFLRNHP